MNKSNSQKNLKVEYDGFNCLRFDCELSKLKCIKPLPKDFAKLALYIVCISDLSSIIKASYDLASSITTSTTFVIFSIICSSFGLLGFYSIASNNKTTTKIYVIYTYVRLVFETITSFGMSILFYIYKKEEMYDDNLPVWLVFLINGTCLTISRIVFSYVAHSFYKGIESQPKNNLDKQTNFV